jgi:hypothetical protein
MEKPRGEEKVNEGGITIKVVDVVDVTVDVDVATGGREMKHEQALLIRDGG